ncbi:MAG: hypothetical protein JWR35_846 [Marmoricola sp.]|nr:hypothetical protein [Marmoricola sp.]
MTGAVPEQPMKDLLAEFIGSARWFGGKGRAFTVAGVRRIPLQSPSPGEAGTPAVAIELVTVAYDDGGTDLYQVPLAYYSEPVDRIGHAYVGSWDDPDFGTVVAYDALHDREATKAWLLAFNRAAPTLEPVETLTFHRLPGHDLDVEVHSTMLSAEQSNSSVAFGDDSMMKVFRRLTPGRNPDIEILEALTVAGNENVAALYGWLEAGDLQVAMLQQFLRTASDGWEQALASVRNLFAEADLHAEEVGGDFAGESHRLGMAVAEVHEALRELFPTTTIDTSAVAASMRARLDAAVSDVPELEPYADAVRAVFDRLAEIPESLVGQRVHGDLHLGQTLRTSKGWKLVDFEGEPAKPLDERAQLDSPWRDVAGMLRSFDYAARSVEDDIFNDDASAAQLAYRADEWVTRNSDAFLAGYLEGRTGEPGELTAEERLIVDAYQADKAVYEVGYEARNRPTWLPIPIGALERLTAARVEGHA